MIRETLALPPPRPPTAAAPANEAALRAQAAAFETAFLAEMLAHAGLDGVSDSFGGGIGEEQFASFLRQEQAAAMVRAGGIGLAESVFRSLAGRTDAA